MAGPKASDTPFGAGSWSGRTEIGAQGPSERVPGGTTPIVAYREKPRHRAGGIAHIHSMGFAWSFCLTLLSRGCIM